MLTLIIVAILALFTFRGIAISKGYPPNRIQLYPLLLLAAVLIPAFFAEQFLQFAVSHQLATETTSTGATIAVNILAFLLYFGVLSRALIRLKKLPNVLLPSQGSRQ